MFTCTVALENELSIVQCFLEFAIILFYYFIVAMSDSQFESVLMCVQYVICLYLIPLSRTVDKCQSAMYFIAL